MSQYFVFVVGDIGGAKMMLPVISFLQKAGVDVEVVVDKAGEGQKVLAESNVPTCMMSEGEAASNQIAIFNEADLLFIGTCGTANRVERAVAAKYSGQKPIVLGADGFFNHNRLDWREVQADYWLAITEEHAADIRRRRPNLAPEKVLVVGNPAFDNLPALYWRKDKDGIRRQRRQELNLTDDQILAVWWSQGTESVLREDVAYACESIRCLSSFSRPVMFAPMIHPKVEGIKAGYIAEIRQEIWKTVAGRRVGILLEEAVRGKMPFEELCLAADVIFDITSTEGIKSNILGGPPVIHFIGADTRRWFENDLGLEPPDYLPDVRSGQSLAANNFMQLAGAIKTALTPLLVISREDYLRQCGWQPPVIDNAAERIANTLLEIAPLR